MAVQMREFRAYREVGPDFWPKIVLICLILSSAYLTLSTINTWRKSKDESAAEDDTSWIRGLLTGALILAYIILLKPVGFLVLTPFFIIGMMLLIKRERKKAIPLTVIVIMVLIYIIFGKLLYVPLPKGYGVFHDVSILLGL
jgi:hypothetical protein